MDGAFSVEDTAGAHDFREDEPGQKQKRVPWNLVVHEDWFGVVLANDIAFARVGFYKELGAI